MVRKIVPIGLILIVGGAFVSSLGVSGVKEYRRTSAIDREIEALESQARELERQTALMEEKVKFLTSSDVYRERTAKEMGYRKKDESVIEVNPRFSDSSPSEDESAENSGSQNGYGWWERLFGRIWRE